jgi:hypothetical protein
MNSTSNSNSAQTDALRIELAKFLTSLHPTYKNNKLYKELQVSLTPFLPNTNISEEVRYLPFNVMNKIASKLDYKYSLTMKRVSKTLPVDLYHQIRKDGAFEKIEQLAELFRAESTKYCLPRSQIAIYRGDINNSRKRPHLHRDPEDFIFAVDEYDEENLNKYDDEEPYLCFFKNEEEPYKHITLNAKGVKTIILDMFLIAAKAGVDIPEIMSNKRIYITGGGYEDIGLDHLVIPRFAPTNQPFIYIKFGSTTNPTWAKLNPAAAAKLLEQDINTICRTLYEKQIISYQSVHIDPNYGRVRSPSSIQYPCVPWTDVLINPKENTNRTNIIEPTTIGTNETKQILKSRGTRGLVDELKQRSPSGGQTAYTKSAKQHVGRDGVSRSVYIKGKSRFVKRKCSDGTFKYSKLRT